MSQSIAEHDTELQIPIYLRTSCMSHRVMPQVPVNTVEMLDKIFRPSVDANCPFHPIPVPLPSSLPSTIRSAIDGVEDLLMKQINNENLVQTQCTCTLIC